MIPNTIQLTQNEHQELINSIHLPNSQFATTIMQILEKYQVLRDDDVVMLTDKAQCKNLFKSEYPMLKEINSDLELRIQIVDRNNRSRFYGNVYTLNEKKYVMTSQLYGVSPGGTHRDNRTPFYHWVLARFGISDDWDPSLTENNPSNYELSKKSGESSMTTKQILDEIKKYIAGKGFTYDGNLIENFYLSLKSKPFVILAGTSGTGKTRLAKLFAEAIGADFKLVPVRPDWSDSSDLFGHTDLSGKFVKGTVIEFISKAIGDPAKPYFLCLDEMNLARVEYYFSDFLSIIETREHKNGRVITDNIEICDKAKEIYGNLYIPDNLYVIGTVNMDETTFPFSKKVLDRANTIEFSYVNLTPKFNENYDDVSPIELQNSFLKTEFIKLSECQEYANDIETICSELESINKTLLKADAHIGYRVRDEICFYMINNKKSELLNDNDAMDNQIMQKILPRIQGSSSVVKNMLCELFKTCAGDFDGYQTESNVADNMMKAVEKGSCKHKNSAAKIASMVRRFEEDGFTSYWI